MELQYYETIRETGHLQVRFEPVLSPAGVFPAHWHEYVEILYIKDGVLSAIVQAVEYELHTGDLHDHQLRRSSHDQNTGLSLSDSPDLCQTASLLSAGL